MTSNNYVTLSQIRWRNNPDKLRKHTHSIDVANTGTVAEDRMAKQKSAVNVAPRWNDSTGSIGEETLQGKRRRGEPNLSVLGDGVGGGKNTGE